MSFPELLQWTQSDKCPEWQSDALRRIAQNGELTSDDMSILIDHILVSHNLSCSELPALEPLSEDHLSQVGSTEQTTILGAIGPVKHVDRLEPNQPPLTFAAAGVTLIYGPNGSGKSGYCRLAKQLCRARKTEDIRGNVFEAPSTDLPEVDVAFKVGDSDKETRTWIKPSSTPPELARISVFDSASARLYVDDDRTVEFLPYELDLMTQLGKAAQDIEEYLKESKAALEAEFGIPLPISDIEGTPVETLLKPVISNSTSDPLPTNEEIDTLAVVTEEDAARRKLLETEAAKDPAILQQSHEDALLAVNSIKSMIEECEATLGKAAIATLIGRSKKVAAKLELSKQTAQSLFSEQPNPKIGQAEWKSMLVAARNFVTETTDPKEESPATINGQCALCQQDLDETAEKRLHAFYDFIDNENKGEAVSAQQEFEENRLKISALNISSSEQIQVTLVGYKKLSKDRAALTEDTDKYFEAMQSHHEYVKTELQNSNFKKVSEIKYFPQSPLQKLMKDLGELEAEIERFRSATTDHSAQRAMLAEIKSINVRLWLKDNRTAFVTRRDKLIEFRNVKAAIDICKSGPITRQLSTRRREVLTGSMHKALEREQEALGLKHLPLGQKERGVKGDTKVSVELKDARLDGKLSSVLSEGEQRALALACFLAELNEIGQGHAIIIDDPVSSLDHERMELVAKRLVEEAKTGRQVIIFTHSIVFHYMVKELTRFERVECREECVSSPATGTFGIIENASAPEFMKNSHIRIEGIETHIHDLETGDYDPKDQSKRKDVEIIYGSMRKAWERIVEEIIFNGAIQRLKIGIMTQSLEEACFEPENDYPIIEKGMAICSRYSGHDRALAMPPELPTLEEIRANLGELKAFRTSANNRRKDLREKREAKRKAQAESI